MSTPLEPAPARMGRESARPVQSVMRGAENRLQVFNFVVPVIPGDQISAAGRKKTDQGASGVGDLGAQGGNRLIGKNAPFARALCRGCFRHGFSVSADCHVRAT
jgi:hypothetical protein